MNGRVIARVADTPAIPDVSAEPDLKESEPSQRPLHDSARHILLGSPPFVDRIEETKLLLNLIVAMGQPPVTCKLTEIRR